MNTPKKIHLEMLRIIAIILVIFSHTDGTIYFIETTNVMTWIFSMVMSCISKINVSLFFMVSGAVLLEKEEPLKVLFHKRIKRMAVVLVATSLFYYLMDFCRYGGADYGIIDFLNKFRTNGIRQSLWFLYSYLGMLLILPFFRKMVKHINSELMRYLFGLKIVFAIILPLIGELFHMQFTLDVGFVQKPIFYMILGYYMENHDTELLKKLDIKKQIGCLIGLVITDIILMQLNLKMNGSYSESIFDLFICMIAPLVWEIVRYIEHNYKGNERITSLLVKVGGCVFGIYLLDNFVRWQFLPLYLFLCEKTVGVFACSVYVFVTFLFGMLYTCVLKRIPIIKDYL